MSLASRAFKRLRELYVNVLRSSRITNHEHFAYPKQLHKQSASVLLEQLEPRLLLASFLVTNAFDSGEGSLREAITAATTPGDDISFDLTGDTTVDLLSALPTITTGILIDGDNTAGSGVDITVDGSSAYRPFAISSTGTNIDVSFSNLTVQNGSAVTGGGIRVDGNVDLFLTDVIVQNNTATGVLSNDGGGGIYAKANGTTDLPVVTLTDSTVSGNSAYQGGGIYMGGGFSGGGTLNVQGASGSLIDDNTAGMGGGIVSFYSTVNIIDSTVSNNHATSNGGGGMWGFWSPTLIENSTIHNNDAFSSGGGVSHIVNSPLTIDGSIISDNVGENGGGLLADGGALIIRNGTTIIGNEAKGFDIGGGVFVAGVGGGALLGGAATITDTQITDNTAREHGGGIFAFGSSVTLDATSSITLNEATTGSGGGIYSFAALTLTGTTVGGVDAGNTAALNGGGIFAGLGTVTLAGATVQYNSSDQDGGGLYADGTYGAATIVVVDTDFDLNTAANDGGGIYVDAVSTASLDTDSTVTSNMATNGDGGGIYSLGTLTITGADIGGMAAGNTAAVNGGGIYVGPDVVLSLTSGAAVSHNTALLGGGLYADTDSQITIAASTFDANEASGPSGASGGGMYLNEIASLAASDSAITNNLAHDPVGVEYSSGNDGGGIYLLLASDNTFANTISNTNISGNKAFSGGGIYMDEGKLTISAGSTVNDNTAESGAGVYALDVDDLTVTGSYVNSNEGILGSTSAFFGGRGGGIRISNGTASIIDSEVSGNWTSGSGGGLAILGGADVSITNSEVNDNQASADGLAATPLDLVIDGNIYGSSGGGITITPNTGSTLVVTNSEISDNLAATGGGLYGSGPATVTIQSSSKVNGNDALMAGGIYTNCTLSMTASEVVGNQALTNEFSDTWIWSDLFTPNFVGDGGGIFAFSAFVTLDDTDIRGNQSSHGDGGGIYMTLNGTLDLSNLTIGAEAGDLNNGKGNTAVNGKGGGLYINDPWTVEFDTVEIRDNEAVDGGGLYLTTNSPTPTITALTVDANTASNDGGGIYTEVDTTVTLDALSPVTANEATADGGGIYTKGTLTINGTTIGGDYGVDGNTAGSDGGGIYSEGEVTLNTGSVVRGNAATANGGGIYSDGTLTLSEATVGGATPADDKNTAGNDGGGIYFDGDVLTLNDALIQNNAADNGGGLFLANSDAGDDSITITSTDFDSNTATTDGGGIYADVDTDFDLDAASTVTSNEATADGGGIYTKGTLTINGTTVGGDYGVDGNTAGSDGGGIYSEGEVTLDIGSVVRGNAATVNGGGIYSDGTLTLDDATVGGATPADDKNTAGNDGGGIYSGSELILHKLSSVLGNTAGHDGGGIYADGIFLSNQDSWPEVDEVVSVDNNAAGHDGGGLYLADTAQATRQELVWTTTFDSNYAGNNGGGIYVGVDASLLVSGESTLNDNQAFNDGGGAYSDTGSEFYFGYLAVAKRNEALHGSGGGIYSLGELLVTNSEIGGAPEVPPDPGPPVPSEGNTAAVTGGGIYHFAPTEALSISGTWIGANEATEGDGGGIYSAVGSTCIYDSVFTWNTALGGNDGKGGGIYSDGDITIGASNGSLTTLFEHNQANAGGGLYNFYGTALFGSFFTRRVARFFDNVATTDGGAIHSIGDLDVENSEFEHNSAGNNGGGIYASAYMQVSKSSMWGNAANNDGGAIHYSGPDGEILKTDESIPWATDLMEIYSSASGHNGGAIFNSGTLYVEGTVIGRPGSTDKNVADLAGGGIYSEGALLTLHGVEIRNNFAQQGGGVAVVRNVDPIAAVIEVTSHITENVALYGAGVYAVDVTSLTVDNSTIDFNRPTVLPGDPYMWYGEGGGLYALRSAVTIQDTSHVSDNWTYTRGGGIFLRDSSLVLEDSFVQRNQGSFDGQVTKALELAAGRGSYAFHCFSSGGGIYIEDTGVSVSSLLAEDSTISSNIAAFGGGVWAGGDIPVVIRDTGDPSNSNVNNNRAIFGGGIYSVGIGASVEIQSTTVYENEAEGDCDDVCWPGGPIAGDGGGIWAGAGAVTITGSGMIENLALHGRGGGIYAESTDLTITMIVMEGNRALNGGAIYLTGASDTNKADITGTVFLNNKALALAADHDPTCPHYGTFGNGGAIFIGVSGSATAVPVTIRDSEFDSNEAGDGGAIYIEGEDSPCWPLPLSTDYHLLVTESKIHDNTAEYNGGGVYGTGVFSDTKIRSNTAKLDGGGAYWNDLGQPFWFIDGTQVEGNTALQLHTDPQSLPPGWMTIYNDEALPKAMFLDDYSSGLYGLAYLVASKIQNNTNGDVWGALFYRDAAPAIPGYTVVTPYAAAFVQSPDTMSLGGAGITVADTGSIIPAGYTHQWSLSYNGVTIIMAPQPATPASWLLTPALLQTYSGALKGSAFAAGDEFEIVLTLLDPLSSPAINMFGEVVESSRVITLLV